MVNVEAAYRALGALEMARLSAVRLQTTMRNSGKQTDHEVETVIKEIDNRIARILPKITAAILMDILERANEGVRIANEAGMTGMPQICLRSGPPS